MEKKDVLRLAENIRKQRMLNLYTEKEIADKLGISKEEYMDFETGKKHPGPAVISQLSAFFQCTLNDLYSKEIIPFVTKAQGTMNDIIYGIRIGDCREDNELIDFWGVYGNKEIGNVLREFFPEQKETENKTFASLIQQLAIDAERFYGEIEATNSDDCKTQRIQTGYSFCSGMVHCLEMIAKKQMKVSGVLSEIQKEIGIADKKEACRIFIMDWFGPFIKTVEAALIWSDKGDREKICLNDTGFSKAIFYEFYNQYGKADPKLNNTEF